MLWRGISIIRNQKTMRAMKFLSCQYSIFNSNRNLLVIFRKNQGRPSPKVMPVSYWEYQLCQVLLQDHSLHSHQGNLWKYSRQTGNDSTLAQDDKCENVLLTWKRPEINENIMATCACIYIHIYTYMCTWKYVYLLPFIWKYEKYSNSRRPASHPNPKL